MKSAGKARNNGLYRHIRTSKEIIRNLLNDYVKKIAMPGGKTVILTALAGLDAQWYNNIIDRWG